jgi:hypothetical protein
MTSQLGEGVSCKAASGKGGQGKFRCLDQFEKNAPESSGSIIESFPKEDRAPSSIQVPIDEDDLDVQWLQANETASWISSGSNFKSVDLNDPKKDAQQFDEILLDSPLDWVPVQPLAPVPTPLPEPTKRGPRQRLKGELIFGFGWLNLRNMRIYDPEDLVAEGQGVEDDVEYAEPPGVPTSTSASSLSSPSWISWFAAGGTTDSELIPEDSVILYNKLRTEVGAIELVVPGNASPNKFMQQCNQNLLDTKSKTFFCIQPDKVSRLRSLCRRGKASAGGCGFWKKTSTSVSG